MSVPRAVPARGPRLNWSLLDDPTEYHWVVAGLLVVFAICTIRRWRYLCARLAWLEDLVQRHAVRQLFG